MDSDKTTAKTAGSCRTGVSAGDISISSVSQLSVPELIRKQADIAPNAIAVCAGSDSTGSDASGSDASNLDRLTYQELDRRSSQLANYLLTLGSTAGSVVSLYLERSANFPVAALAILKAGCAYLPLETKTPVRRLQTMLKAAQVSVVITNSNLQEALTGDGRKLLALDRCAAEISSCSEEAPPIHITADHLAYVIFTSGSTGAPKAVAIGHDSLLNLIQWHNRAFAVTAADRATQVASIGFDAAVWELWPHLVAGASVHIVDDETRTQPEKLRDYLVREKITISFVPTPLAERMLKVSGSKAWPKETALRFLLTGADTLHAYPPVNLPFTVVNNYGPTECTVVATSAAVSAQKSSANGSAERLPAIGRAINKTQIYILDGKMQCVAAGETGEIYIGGAGLAKGYLNDSALTAERFLELPISGGARLYRTGDLGCYRPDGQLAFCGRVDEQVKINGYRIELNEIAGVLKRHPGLRESTVVAREIVARESEAGEKQLVAYIVPITDCPSVGELRDFLSNDLPDYMIPSTFVSVDALPIASSGKLNRLALPAPSDQNTLREEIFLDPRTPTEQRVAAIVARLLGLQQVGVNDNFFYLGGNSLFGTQVIARLRDAFSVDISLLKLFDHPTVADLAAEVDRLILAKFDAMSDEEAQRLLALHTEQASA